MKGRSRYIVPTTNPREFVGMEPWQLALVVKPIAFMVLMGAIVIPIELALRHVWPDSAVKRVLFGRNFDKRHPYLWTGLIVGFYVVMALLGWAAFALQKGD